ncbi:hypothetical protein NDU88_011113 [Pleurodeles waltl]|uniref:Uncharacterized protein n=1 Tax=Pleurodeles waltl TaxID=8319 RepID=A0AAV7S3V5_PLEWA|nr:hypothetical protein NDU88_011113 [Pleurodeles waltl]
MPWRRPAAILSEAGGVRRETSSTRRGHGTTPPCTLCSLPAYQGVPPHPRPKQRPQGPGPLRPLPSAEQCRHHGGTRALPASRRVAAARAPSPQASRGRPLASTGGLCGSREVRRRDPRDITYSTSCSCDGSDQADPHTIITCAVSAPGSTEATQGDPLPIGSLPRPRENDAVKGVVPPIQGGREGIQRWRSRVPTGERKEEQRRTTEEEDTKDAWNPLQESGPEPESRSLRTRRRDEDRWPRGAHE